MEENKEEAVAVKADEEEMKEGFEEKEERVSSMSEICRRRFRRKEFTNEKSEKCDDGEMSELELIKKEEKS